jgi:hypothetical protein
VVFVEEDGSFLNVTKALREEYAGLVDRDEVVLAEIGQTLTLRFEVNSPTILDPLLSVKRQIFIDCVVAGLYTQGLSSGLVGTTAREEADIQNLSCALSTGAHALTGSHGRSLPQRSPSSSRSLQRYGRIFDRARSHVDISQEAPRCGRVDPEHKRWKLGAGQDDVRYEDLRMASLEQVSQGSWQVRLFHKSQD